MAKKLRFVSPSDTRGPRQKKQQKASIRSKSSASGATLTSSSSRLPSKKKTLAKSTKSRLSASRLAGERDDAARAGRKTTTKNVAQKSPASKARKASSVNIIKSDIKKGIRDSKAKRTKSKASAARSRVSAAVSRPKGTISAGGAGQRNRLRNFGRIR